MLHVWIPSKRPKRIILLPFVFKLDKKWVKTVFFWHVLSLLWYWFAGRHMSLHTAYQFVYYFIINLLNITCYCSPIYIYNTCWMFISTEVIFLLRDVRVTNGCNNLRERKKERERDRELERGREKKPEFPTLSAWHLDLSIMREKL